MAQINAGIWKETKGLNALQIFGQAAVGTGAGLIVSSGSHNVGIKNISTGGQVIYISNSSGVTTGNGFQLLPGEFISLDNRGGIYAISSAASGNVCYYQLI